MICEQIIIIKYNYYYVCMINLKFYGYENICIAFFIGYSLVV